jgi:hypothetical protein
MALHWDKLATVLPTRSLKKVSADAKLEAARLT